ncbi:MAG: hypothetical protein HZC12_10305 [Nitrospirae bacterium]|nr:hypothetical protein [Nitrospirota bacterium]
MEAESREQRTECKKYIIKVREVVQSHPYPNDTTLINAVIGRGDGLFSKKVGLFSKNLYSSILPAAGGVNPL